MANLGTPKINVAFTELGASAVQRGDKGVVALMVKEENSLSPLSLTQASGVPGTLTAENQAYIQRAFLGYVNPPKKVLVYIGAAGSGANPTGFVSGALTWLATQDFDYLAGPPDCSAEEAAAIASWVKSQRLNSGAKYKAVLPNYSGDHYAIVNFTGAGIQAGTSTYSAAAYCSRIAGLLAGTPMRISATYAPLPEVGDVTRLDAEAQETAVNAGQLIPIWDGRKVKLSRAVNSLVTTSQGMLDSFKKIKIVEIMDLMRTDLRQTCEDSYVGKFANSYDNKLLLVTAVRGYLEGLRIDGLIQEGYTAEIDVERQAAWLMAQGTDTGEMDEQAIREADTGSQVFLLVRCKILDAIEDITINVEI